MRLRHLRVNGAGAVLHLVALVPAAVAPAVLVGAGRRHRSAVLGGLLMVVAMTDALRDGGVLPPVLWALVLAAAAMIAAAAGRFASTAVQNPPACASARRGMEAGGLLVMALLLAVTAPHPDGGPVPQHAAPGRLEVVAVVAVLGYLVACAARVRRGGPPRERVHHAAMGLAAGVMAAAVLLPS